MSLSEVAAWWGAGIASMVLLWDIYKWLKSKSNVKVSASPNMQTINSIEGCLGDEKYIAVEVVNQSDRLTTITHLVIAHYQNVWHKLINKKSTQGVITDPLGGPPIPHELAPGARWIGMINQNDVVTKIGESGLFYCGVLHTAKKNPVMVKVKLS